MNGVSNLWGREPAVILGLAQAAIALAISFGLGWTAEQVGAIMAFLNIALAVLTRSQVTPTDKIDDGDADLDHDGDLDPPPFE